MAELLVGAGIMLVGILMGAAIVTPLKDKNDASD